MKLETAHCLKFGQTLRMQCETAISEVIQGFSRNILFYGSCFFRKLQIESSHFLYTTWIHVLVVRIIYISVAMSVHLSFSAMYLSTSSGSFAVIYEQKIKPIININHERMNTVEI